MVDRPLWLILFRLVFVGNMKVKIGYTASLLDRRGNHQCGNSDKVYNLIAPLRFGRSSVARRFERLAQNMAGDDRRVHGAGHGQEWYFINMRTLLRIQYLYKTSYNLPRSIWPVRFVKFFRIIAEILKLPLWIIVIILWIIRNALSLADSGHRYAQPVIRKILKAIPKENETSIPLAHAID